MGEALLAFAAGLCPPTPPAPDPRSWLLLALMLALIAALWLLGSVIMGEVRP